MRVIAGKFRGRKLVGPKGDNFRPTLDRVKESIFNVLGQDMVDSNVLDLFCGSGALGIEAISRGAMRATFVDAERQILDLARKNVQILGLEKKAKFILMDVFDFLTKSKDLTYDLIIADPPYDIISGARICDEIIANNVLKSNGILVLERRNKQEVKPSGFKIAKTLTFGQTEVDFFIREA